MNLVVPDVIATTDFFVKHFEFQVHSSHSTHIAVLHGSGNFVLVVSNFPNTPSYQYPKDFHIGFYQPDQAAVDGVFEKLRKDVQIDSSPRKIRDRYGFYFYAPGEILIEITCPQADRDPA